MPAVRYYEVTQTRSVRVAAVSPADAMLISNQEFSKESRAQQVVPETELQGHVISDVEVTNVDIRKEL